MIRVLENDNGERIGAQSNLAKTTRDYFLKLFTCSTNSRVSTCSFEGGLLYFD